MTNEEIFVGNTQLKNWPHPWLKGLKTLRLGEQSYDIHGKELPTDKYRPVYVGKSEYNEYNRQMKWWDHLSPQKREEYLLKFRK